jgi:peptidoglycan/LPS O-acetylase OafA/YrhL
MQEKRIHYLDSARGIAAMAVVIYHCCAGYGDHRLFGISEQHIVSFFLNGADAVSFFFVLSGFVLSYKYFLEDSLPNYPKYILSRMFRLYPAFWFMMIVFSIYTNSGFKGFSLYWVEYVKEASLYQNFTTMLGQAWSLNIELALSLLLPVFIAAAQREIRFLYYLLPMTLIFHAFISPFFIHFILGIIAAYWLVKKTDLINSVYQWLKKYIWLTLPMIWLAFSGRHLWKLFFPTDPEGYKWFGDYTGIDFFGISAIASFFILVIMLQSARLQAFLNLSIFKFLGKISYSLYICHWFFLFAVFSAKHDFLRDSLHLGERTTMVLVSALTVVSSILFATLMYYLVEKPFIKWGRKAANKLAF